MKTSGLVECTCWAACAVIVVLVASIWYSEWSRPPARRPHERAGGASRDGVRFAQKAEVARNEEYDESGNFMLASGEECEQKDASDTAHFFTDSGADAESYKPTNKKRAGQASNVRSATFAQSDTGSPTAPPSRIRGYSDNSWLQLLSCDKQPRALGTTEIAFGGSSHLEALRSGMYTE